MYMNIYITFCFNTDTHILICINESVSLYSPWNSLCQNTEVGSLSHLQGILPTQRLNPGLPLCRQILYKLSHKESPSILKWLAYPFSSGSSQPRNRTGVSCIAGRFFTNWTIRKAHIYQYLALNIVHDPQ